MEDVHFYILRLLFIYQANLCRSVETVWLDNVVSHRGCGISFPKQVIKSWVDVTADSGADWLG